MKIVFPLLILSSLIVITVAFSLPVFATGGESETPPGIWEKIKAPLGELGEKSGFVAKAEAEPKSPAEIAGGIIKVFLGLLGATAVILMVYGGYMWMTAGGNEERLTKAKQVLSRAVIGLIIVIMAYSIAYFVIQQIATAAR